MTYAELLEMAESCGMNNAQVALGRMMDQVEEDAGEWPAWSDPVPEWILESFGF